EAGGEQRDRDPEGAGFLQRFEAEIVKGNRIGRRALIGIEGGSERVNRDERAVAHWKRIAVKPGAVRLRGALGRDVRDVHEIRIERGRTGEGEDLAGGVRADGGLVDAAISSWIERVSGELERR